MIYGYYEMKNTIEFKRFRTLRAKSIIFMKFKQLILSDVCKFRSKISSRKIYSQKRVPTMHANYMLGNMFYNIIYYYYLVVLSIGLIL